MFFRGYEIGGACGMHGGGELCIQNLSWKSWTEEAAAVWCLPTVPHSISTKNANIDIFLAVRTRNLESNVDNIFGSIWNDMLFQLS